MRFPVYESLYFLNRNVEDILVILEQIKKSPGMPKNSFEAYQVEIQYLRSHATQDVLEVMNDREIHEMAKLGKQKKAYDDSIRDLDDVYFEVQRREEQRREQGLPPLIGVLPRKYEDHFSTPEERWEPDEVADPTPSRAVHSKGRTTVLGPRFCRGTSPRTTLNARVNPRGRHDGTSMQRIPPGVGTMLAERSIWSASIIQLFRCGGYAAPAVRGPEPMGLI